MVDPDDVRRGYDELAETYAERRPAEDPSTEILREFLDDAPDPGRILDAGCGQGAPVLSEVDRAASAVGIDLSRGQLGLASDAVPAAHLLQSDMARLPFDDDVFDGVVAFWSLIHVPLADHGTAIEEFARVLRPGGRVLLCEGTNEWVGANESWLDSGVEMEWEIAGADHTRELLEAAGFAIGEEWRVHEPLADDAADEGDDDGGGDDGDLPWTIFAARSDA